MKVYTKAGDKGLTSLFGGSKISKDDIRIEAYGTVDELNCHIGLLISLVDEPEINDFLRSIQSMLFDIGSHLASDGTANQFLPHLPVEIVNKLEMLMDDYTGKLPELKSFILPRGNQRIAVAHICRTVCRRAERRTVSLSRSETIDEFIVVFLNRLSDYFFVLSRYLSLLDDINEEKWNSK